MHPQVIGRGHRMLMLGHYKRIRDRGDVEFTTLEQAVKVAGKQSSNSDLNNEQTLRRDERSRSYIRNSIFVWRHRQSHRSLQPSM